MPQFGRISGSNTAVVDDPGAAPAAPWSVRAALLQLVTFEVDAEATLDLLPEMLSRPAPPYARVLVADYPDSPVGPYREATLLLSCRYLMLPRQLVVASVVTSEAARVANARNWHYPGEVGEIALSGDGDRTFMAQITTPSGLDATISSVNAQETGVATIRYDPTVVVQPGDGLAKVLTVSAEPSAVHKAWLAQSSTFSCSVSDRGSAWWRLRSKNPITGTIATVDVERPLPTPVEPPAPGSGGGLP